MKESDYILATNLAKLRIAYSALSDCMMDGKEDALKVEALRAMDRLSRLLETRVERKVRADE